jgi:hypothetical protein
LSPAGGKGNSFTVSGATLVVKPAKSRVNVMRDGSLKAAASKLQSVALGKNVKIDHKERTVSVDGTPGFLQEAGDLPGRVLAPYTNLTI